jgi:hypothetical protein
MMEAVNCDETLKESKFSPYYTVWYPEDRIFHSHDSDSIKSRTDLTHVIRRAMIMRLVARILWWKPDSTPTQSIRNLLWINRHFDTFFFKSLVLSVSFHQCFTSIFIYFLSTVKRRCSSVDIVTKLQPRRPRNRSLIPGRGMRFVSSSKRPYKFGARPASYSVGNGLSSPRDKAAFAWG